MASSWLAPAHSSHAGDDTWIPSPGFRGGKELHTYRGLSADSPVSRRRFDSPDRYISGRVSPNQHRVSKPPAALRGIELYSRQSHGNPLRPRSTSDNQSHLPEFHRLGVPHYTPSFIIGDDTRHEPDRHRQVVPTRHISLGGVWNVGGSLIAQGPTHAVPDGRGGHFASGTSAPMYRAGFMKDNTVDRERNNHEARLALAMELDQAARSLQIPRPWSMPATPSSSPSPTRKPEDV